jgi:uncharacterized protein (TIGR03435 family)
MRAPFVILLILGRGVTMGQSTPADPTFEVADVHASADGTVSSGRLVAGSQIEFRGATLLRLIALAYSFDQTRISGGPKLLDVSRFDVIAQAHLPSREPELRTMMRTLLRDRFGLKVRTEERPFPVYTLTPAKRGLQLKASGGEARAECKNADEDGAIVYTCHGLTMAALAARLPFWAPLYFDHPAVDKTGAEGPYDFSVRWTPRGATVGEAISPFDDLEKHLGIKVILDKIPQQVLVVDDVNLEPTPNAPGLKESVVRPSTEFEAVEINPTTGDRPQKAFDFTHGRLNVAGMPLKRLIVAAYNLDDDRISGGEKWVDTVPFDVIAKTDPAVSFDGMRPMLQRLLVERFKLVTHQEDRPVAVFALVAGNHVKLEEGDPATHGACKLTATNSLRTYACQNVRLAEFAEKLRTIASVYITHPVIDLTGLKGSYTFTMSWTPMGLAYGNSGSGRGGDASSGATQGAHDPSGGATIFDAIEKQLGLKLTQQKYSMPVRVIDHAERVQ